MQVVDSFSYPSGAGVGCGDEKGDEHGDRATDTGGSGVCNRLGDGYGDGIYYGNGEGKDGRRMDGVLPPEYDVSAFSLTWIIVNATVERRYV